MAENTLTVANGRALGFPSRRAKRNRPDRWPLPLVAVLLGVAYGGLYLSVTLVTTFGGSSGTTFWPSAGVTVAVLLRRSKREWPVLLSSVWLVEFVLDLWVSDVSVGVSAGWATANTVEPTVAALLLTLGGRALDLSRSKDLLRFAAFGVVTGPAIGALIGTGSGAVAGFYDLWPAFPRWFAGDATGALVVAPMLLIDWRRAFPRLAAPETLGIIVGLGIVSVLVTVWDVPWDDPLPFVLVPILVLAALRIGSAGVALGIGMVAFTVNFMTATGHGPFAIEDEVAGLIEAQAFLAVAAFTALLVAALTRDLITAAEADEAKNTLLETVAHDLRGPLSAVSGLAQTLQEQQHAMTETDRNEVLTRIRATGDRLNRMVDRILDLERLRHGATGPRRRPTDVGAHVQRLVASLDDLNAHVITVDASSLVAEVDPDEVDRIVENLIGNAVRHTPAGTRVWTKVEPVPNGVLISVEDDGPGIDDTLKDELFQAFQSGRTDHPGAGIGLNLVSRFAERHDGRAWVEDRAGGGAAFRVYLRAGISGSVTGTSR